MLMTYVCSCCSVNCHDRVNAYTPIYCLVFQVKKSLFHKKEDNIARSFWKVKTTQSLVLSPTYDSDEEELEEEEEKEEEEEEKRG